MQPDTQSFQQVLERASHPLKIWFRPPPHTHTHFGLHVALHYGRQVLHVVSAVNEGLRRIA